MRREAIVSCRGERSTSRRAIDFIPDARLRSPRRAFRDGNPRQAPRSRGYFHRHERPGSELGRTTSASARRARRARARGKCESREGRRDDRRPRASRARRDAEFEGARRRTDRSNEKRVMRRKPSTRSASRDTRATSNLERSANLHSDHARGVPSTTISRRIRLVAGATNVDGGVRDGSPPDARDAHRRD